MRITAVTCVKNEGPFLLEWIAFNRVIGVTDFLIYSNDCTDATDDLLDALAAAGVVHHLPNPAEGRHYQMEALSDARNQALVQSSDWLWIADVDEFLNIHVGNNTIPELIEACGNPTALSVTFQYFANNGIDAFEDRPVISQFQMSHNPDVWCGQTAIEVKTLVRQDFPLRRFGAHRPFIKRNTERKPKWTDASGRAVPPRFFRAANKRRIHKFPAKGARRFATLNHYALRSLDSYIVKKDRGDVNRAFRDFDDIYWRERNDPAFHDPSILRYMPRLEAEIAALKALPNVSDLHDLAVQRHAARCAELMKDPSYQDMRNLLKNANRYAPDEAEVRELIGWS